MLKLIKADGKLKKTLFQEETVTSDNRERKGKRELIRTVRGFKKSVKLSDKAKLSDNVGTLFGIYDALSIIVQNIETRLFSTKEKNSLSSDEKNLFSQIQSELPPVAIFSFLIQ